MNLQSCFFLSTEKEEIDHFIQVFVLSVEVQFIKCCFATIYIFVNNITFLNLNIDESAYLSAVSCDMQ